MDDLSAPTRWRHGTPDFDEILAFQKERRRPEIDLTIAAVMLAICMGLFSLALFAMSDVQARGARPSFCAPDGSAAECMAAAQERVGR